MALLLQVFLLGLERLEPSVALARLIGVDGTDCSVFIDKFSATSEKTIDGSGADIGNGDDKNKESDDDGGGAAAIQTNGLTNNDCCCVGSCGRCAADFLSAEKTDKNTK